jgi:transketolase N-terminal domain/subunit
MRRDIVELCYRSPDHKAHLGGCLSAVEILCALYLDVMHLAVSADDPNWDRRDRFVLSKGHAAFALYAALHQAGIFSDQDMKRPICGPDALPRRQVMRNPAHGLEATCGSLGMGLGYACGLAIALKRKNLPSHVYVLLGDGECDEGSIWEAAAFAAHNQLANLTVIVDANGLQLDGPTDEILSFGNMAERWAAFGFDAHEVDGHDVISVRDMLRDASKRKRGVPIALIAHTVKGKGVSFAENNIEWHDGTLDDALYQRALYELDGGR